MISEKDRFGERLFDCLIAEVGSNDVQRLLLIVSVAIGLINEDNTNLVKEKVLPFIMSILTHRYPRVRQWCAEQLHLKFHEDGSFFVPPENFNCVNMILSDVTWSNDLQLPGKVGEARNRLANLLHVSLSDKEQKDFLQKERKHRVVDEFESYSSLVYSTRK